MDCHFVGKEFPFTPDPSPYGRGEAEGSSLAVRQFVELVRGERMVAAPVGCGVVVLQAVERYCLGCCGVRWFDVGRGADGVERAAWCRCCGKERG